MGEFVGVLWTASKLLCTVGRHGWILMGGKFMTMQKPWCPDIKTMMSVPTRHRSVRAEIRGQNLSNTSRERYCEMNRTSGRKPIRQSRYTYSAPSVDVLYKHTGNVNEYISFYYYQSYAPYTVQCKLKYRGYMFRPSMVIFRLYFLN